MVDSDGKCNNSSNDGGYNYNDGGDRYDSD